MKNSALTASCMALLLFFPTVCLPVKSETYNLTLEQSIEIAKEKSYRMLTLQQEIRIAEFNLKSATSRLKTHIDLTLSLPEYTETVRQKADSTGVFFSVKQLTYSSGLTINQPLPTDGNIFIQSGLSSFMDYYAGMRSANMNTRLGFRQPIDAFYGYNALRSALKNAQLAYERSNNTLKREELDLVYDVSSAYYNLLSLQKGAEIAQLDLERQSEAFEISKNKYEAGLIREVDALQMEVDLAEAQSNYDRALLAQNSSINSFKELLGINLDDSIALSSNLDYKIIVVDIEKAVQLALQNRLEIREEEIRIEIQKLNVKQQKVNGMIRGNINAYFEKVGVAMPGASTNIPGSIQKSYTDFINRPYNYGVGFTISIPVFDWGENRSLVRAAEARLKQYTYNKSQVERNIETEVRNLAAAINSNLKRLQLLEKNVAVAEKSFGITLQRFSDGDIDSQALALERNRLNTAYTSHLGAYISYQLTLADLMRKTFYDFRNDERVE
ncbi:MAG: TolC family protein [Dysgonamonadaceae bacterium]|jgi:outer membrane protein TolC|nr:TolC family protein [Dysgonamonadaceae bacterium]